MCLQIEVGVSFNVLSRGGQFANMMKNCPGKGPETTLPADFFLRTTLDGFCH